MPFCAIKHQKWWNFGDFWLWTVIFHDDFSWVFPLQPWTVFWNTFISILNVFAYKTFTNLITRCRVNVISYGTQTLDETFHLCVVIFFDGKILFNQFNTKKHYKKVLKKCRHFEQRSRSSKRLWHVQSPSTTDVYMKFSKFRVSMVRAYFFFTFF